jgi:hypothetical protein
MDQARSKGKKRKFPSGSPIRAEPNSSRARETIDRLITTRAISLLLAKMSVLTLREINLFLSAVPTFLYKFHS